jgi:penicillin-binding protein 2
MLNAPHNSIFQSTESPREDDRLQHSSPWRIYGVGAAFCLAAMAVLGRVTWLQAQLNDDYLATLETTTTEYEIIPARDGRILTATTVLATDVDRYDLQLNYRWIEEPVNERWLDRKLRNRLTRAERNDEQLVARIRDEIIQSRQRVHQAICDAAGISLEELTLRCTEIQTRVERVAEFVNRRHAGRDDSRDLFKEDEGILMRLASTVRSALTTPPRRGTLSRIVVREEEAFHTVVDDVTLVVAAAVSEHPERFSGARSLVRTVRTYPQRDLAAHVVGARTLLKDDELQPERPSDGRLAGNPVVRRGRFGVELTYEDQISGTHGLRKIVRDRRKRVVSDEVVRPPVSGRDIVLTINTALQQLCEASLRESLADAPLKHLLPAQDQASRQESRPVPVGGSIVVMEAATGRILAAASGPGFDLSLFTGASAAEWDVVNNDRRRPFIPRFTGMALPPGSTFKTLTAIAALESGTITPDSKTFCQGYLTRPSEHRCLIFRLYGASHGQMNVETALSQSCNVFFFDAARRMGMRTLSEWTERLQFGHPTGVDLPFEKSGTVPKAPGAVVQTSTGIQSRFEREAPGLAIGQSRLTVTPLQMARLMAAVANGGWLVTPHIVSNEGIARVASEKPVAAANATRMRVTGLHQHTLDAIRAGLKATVQSPRGTGYRDVRTGDVQIAGKTGTAETAPGKPDHAWFAGYLPADDPQIVIVVVLEHGGSGSHAAGPVAREVSREIARQIL